ncbi:MAG: ABC transporter permease [Bacteroidota bacterium]
MSLLECIRVALEGIRTKKMRSFLTMLGIIIGVGAVIAMTSIGEGAKENISERIKGLGSNLLIVMPGRTVRPGGPAGALGSAKILETQDADAILAKCSAVAAVAPEASTGAVVKWTNKNTTTTITGVTPDYARVRNVAVATGSFFTARDLQKRRKVAVLGPDVADTLFGSVSPIGRKIKVGRVRFQVIGVTKSKGQSGFMSNDDQVFIPLTTAQQRLIGSKRVRTIYVQAKDEASMSLASKQISRVLSRRFSEDEFSVRNQAEILSTVQSTTQVFTLLLAAIASISLLVGGIGIMNIMLVSVTERTREIGIRKAIGARRGDILRQFLIESVVLSTLGGLLGVGLGLLGATGIAKLGKMTTLVPAYSVGVAFAFAMAVGLFFGIYPAAKAASLNPIEALRYE